MDMGFSRLAIVLTLLVAGCGGSDAGQVPASFTAMPPDTTSAIGDETDDTMEQVKRPDELLIEQAREDLSGHLGVSVESIELITFERGIWADGSLGCPEEGKLYTQAVVIGTRMILSHAGESFAYHQAGDEPPFLCEDPVEGAFSGQGGDALIPPPGYDE